jgi:cytochrome c553
MKRLLRWTAMLAGALVALGVLAVIAVYALSQQLFERRYPLPQTAGVEVLADPESIAEGGRLATVRGCVGGCHGRQAEGAVMFDQPVIARLVAPNLTAAVRERSAAELDLAIRHGLRPDGRSLLVMPSSTFAELSDADLGRIIAFLRSLPPADGPGPHVTVGPLGRLGLVTGKFKMEAQLKAESAPPPAATGETAKLGRYLAVTVCGHCHGLALHGTANPEFTSPDLAVVAGFSPQAFTDLLRTGTALGGRTLPTMSPYARQLLSKLTDAEIAALYGYLRDLPAQARQ